MHRGWVETRHGTYNGNWFRPSKLDENVYPSQMDCVWMLKQNGGGICDHEVGEES